MDAEVSLKAINVGGRRVLQATMRDITERKKIEEMKDNLIRDVSHSLKTPIAISSMAVDVIKKGIENKDPVTVNTGHSIASNNVKRALKNVNNILDISFFDRKGKARTKQEVSLVDTIKSNLQTFKESIEQKGLEVKLGISKDAETVFFIPSDLMTLFDNLIENAVKFTREGNVSITGENKNGAVEVKIKDTGRGMDAEETKRVFEKFYKKRAAEPGIGLGLSICKEIIERNDAKIEVISEGIGKGTTVTLHLPRMPKQGG
jgi:signal transduction histidine kinase